MLRRSGREQLLGCVRVGERVARQTNLSIECRAKRRELRLSSASEGNRDGRQEAVGLQISCDGEFTGASDCS